MKLKLPSFHTPTWHSGGKKYRLGKYADISFGFGDDGKFRARWKSGMREHKKPVVRPHSFVPRLTSLRSMTSPQSSARSLAAQGNYKNPLRSTVYG